MRRRAFVSLCVGAVPATAGCLNSPFDTGEEETTSGGNRSSPATTAAQRASVSLLSYQPGLLKRTTPETLGMFTEPETAYAFFEVNVSTPNDRPGRRDFELQFDGETYHPLTDLDDEVFVADGDQNREPYDWNRDSGWLLYELPASGDAADLRLAGAGSEWEPDETTRRRFATAGRDIAIEADAPETVEPGASPTVSISATNRGAVPGRFLGTLRRSVAGEVDLTLASESRLVPADGSITWEYTDSSLDPETLLARSEDGGPDPDVTYRFTSTRGTVTRDVRVVES